MEILMLVAISVVVILVIQIKYQRFRNKVSGNNVASKSTPQNVRHKKKEHLATRNEQKLYFALQKALDDKYVIHSQVSLIALVEPCDFRDRSKSWAKRMDFVITDTATKIIAVIELDDSSHLTEKRIKRDAYVNDALEGNHPLVRLSTKKFYDPKEIADILEEKAGIKSIFAGQEQAHENQTNMDSSDITPPPNS